MAVNLQKGQKVDLTKGNDGLKAIMVGLGWDEAKQGSGLLGMFKQQQTVDCDASAIVCDINGKAVDCIYFGKLRHSSDAIIHQGDNLTGEGDGDDEQIFIDLSRMPSDIHKIVIVVNIYDARKKNQHFGMIKNAFIRIVNQQNGVELLRFALSEDYTNMTGLITGEVYRRDGNWKFNAVGQAVEEASRLEALINMYK